MIDPATIKKTMIQGASWPGGSFPLLHVELGCEINCIRAVVLMSIGLSQLGPFWGDTIKELAKMQLDVLLNRVIFSFDVALERSTIKWVFSILIQPSALMVEEELK